MYIIRKISPNPFAKESRKLSGFGKGRAGGILLINAGHILRQLLEPISKSMRAQITVTPAKAGVHFKPWETWIPAFAGMTTEYGVMMKRNFEIGSKHSREYCALYL